jgi:hypothetical protein
MPRMIGAEATRVLRASGFKGVIMCMTGDPSGCAERQDFESSGTDACVNKDREGIRAVIEQLTSMALESQDGEQLREPAQ